MPATEVIDLSLSTDDESTPQPRATNANARSAKPTSTAITRAPLSDDFDLDISPEFSRLSKRRRISPQPAPTAGTLPDLITSSIDAGAAPLPLVTKPTRASKLMIDSDPILFSSSPLPISRHVPTVTTTATTVFTSESLLNRSPSPVGGQSEKTAIPSGSDDDSDASEFDMVKLSRTSKSSARRLQVHSESVAIPLETSRPKPPPNRKPTTAASTGADKERLKAERAAARLANAEAKAAAKVENAARKKAAREEKAREKQHAADLAEANKARHDKRISTPEMIVDLPSSIEGKSVHTKIKEQLKNLDVETSTYTSQLPNIIKWRRKVNIRWNEEAGYWVPLRPGRIDDEPHVLAMVSALDFVAMVAPDTSEDERLKMHVGRVKTKFPGAKIIYLIEGLEAWSRKSKNAKNREFQAAVRAQEPSERAGTKAKANSKESVMVDEAAVEDALLSLQVVHECLVYHTARNGETAEWVVHFTQHISTIPYRTVRNNISTTFCMDTGQVRTGDDAPDIYVRMLQQVVRVTAPIAYGIAAEYPDVLALIKGFDRKGPSMLEDLKKSANRTGGFSEARIGPAISKRLEKVFVGNDPSSMDV